MRDLLNLSLEKHLEDEDLYDLTETDKAAVFAKHFDELWQQKSRTRTPLSTIC
jgi:hypothetical protein